MAQVQCPSCGKPAGIDASVDWYGDEFWPGPKVEEEIAFLATCCGAFIRPRPCGQWVVAPSPFAETP